MTKLITSANKSQWSVHLATLRGLVQQKYWQVYSSIRAEIFSKQFGRGDRLPTERQFADRFAVSRPTVIRALNELESEGLIVRRPGSGSFVCLTENGPTTTGYKLGLLVPGLGRGEIFEPVCARIAERSSEQNCTLSWGGATPGVGTANGSDIIGAAERLVEQGLDGVFFEPLELIPDASWINRRVAETLKTAGTAVVLLDCDYLPFPERSEFDVVGLDNLHAAYTATQHLLSGGTQRVDFLARPYTANTERLRRSGYQQALVDGGVSPNVNWIHYLDPDNYESVRGLIDSGARDIVCVNDETAAVIIQQLEEQGLSVPQDVRLVGVDDIKYARLVRVPLTTIHQPCSAIGDLAVDAMLSRLTEPNLLPRHFTVIGNLVVRASSRPRRAASLLTDNA